MLTSQGRAVPPGLADGTEDTLEALSSSHTEGHWQRVFLLLPSAVSPLCLCCSFPYGSFMNFVFLCFTFVLLCRCLIFFPVPSAASHFRVVCGSGCCWVRSR